MFCVDCGVNQGSKMRVNHRTLRLCEPCAEDRAKDGETIEGYEDWQEQREDERADRALADR